MQRLFLLAFLLQSAFLGVSQVVLDNFNDNTLTGWSPSNSMGNVHTLTEANGELKLDFVTADPTQFPNTTKSFPTPLNLGALSQMKLRVKTSTPITQIVNIRVDLIDNVGKSTSLNPFELTPIIVDGTYHDYTYDFSGKWTHFDGTTTDSTQIVSLVLFINYGGSGAVGGAGTIFFDDIVMEASPCAGVVPDLNILEDFDCQSNIQNLFTTGVLSTISNPDTSTFNTSANSGMYVRDTSSFDVVIGNFPSTPLDLTTFNKFKLQTIAPQAGMGFQLLLQDAGGNQVASSFQTNALAGEWEELVFDFSAQSGNNTVTQLLLLINPGSNVQDTFYLDNIRMDSSAVPLTACSGTVFNPLILDDFDCQRNLTGFGVSGVLTIIDNPDASTFNTSNKSAKYVRSNAQFDVIFGDFPVLPLDLSVFNKVKVQVISPSAGINYQMSLQDNVGGQIGGASATNSLVGEWEELVFDFSAISTASNVSKMVFLIDPGNTVVDTFTLDNIRLDSSAVPLTECSLVATDTTILDDFECQRNLQNLGTSGGALEEVDNPQTTGVNTSETSGKYVRTANAFDVIIGDFLGAPLDLTSYNQIKLQAISPRQIPIQITLQDAMGNQIQSETQTISTVDVWEELTFDFSSISANTTVTQMILLLDPNNPQIDTFWLDNLRLDTVALPPPGPCSGIPVDSLIVDDFECQRNMQNPVISGTLAAVANPSPDAVNGSATVGKYNRTNAAFDVVITDFLGAPIDMSSNNQVRMQVISPRASVPVQVTLQDTAGAQLLSVTRTVSAANAWEQLNFDFSSLAANTTVGQMVLLIDPNNPVVDTFFLDNIRLDTAAVAPPGPCSGVATDSLVINDFECQQNFANLFSNGALTTVVNPITIGINASDSAGQYVRTNALFDVIVNDFLQNPLDLTVTNQISMQMISPTANLPVQITVQDAAGNELLSRTDTVVTTNTWEALSFDFSDIATSTSAAKMVLLVNPNSSVTGTYFFDNIRLDTGVVVTPGPCDTVATDLTVFDNFECQRNITYTQIDGSLDSVANPLTAGINSSASVGQYDRSNSPFAVIAADFAGTNLDLSNGTEIRLQVLSPAAGVDVQISLQDATGNTVESVTSTVTNANTWEELSFDFSAQAGATNVTKMLMLINAGNSTAATYYLDNFRILSTVGIDENDLSGLNLFKVYPNPAAEQVQVAYELKEATTVEIEVLDMFGKRVASLLRERKPAGAHDLNWQIPGLVDGMYFVRIATEQGAVTTKLLIRR